MIRLLPLVMISAVLVAANGAWGDEPSVPHSGTRDDAGGSHQQQEIQCQIPGIEQGPSGAVKSVQIETSDIRRFEQFFEAVLHAPVVERNDHPGRDSLRGYCYRGLLIVVRQDFRTPRPTGWVQINFTVSDVASMQAELERAYRASPPFQLSETERDQIVRFRLKPDVMRSGRRVTRLEVTGPEGFMIGFDQSSSSDHGSARH